MIIPRQDKAQRDCGESPGEASTPILNYKITLHAHPGVYSCSGGISYRSDGDLNLTFLQENWGFILFRGHFGVGLRDLTVCLPAPYPEHF